jgi:hypothetical protein
MMGQFNHCLSQEKRPRVIAHAGNEETQEKTFLCKFVAGQMTPFFLCNTHNKGSVHNEHTCWGGLAIVTSREEERASC